MIVLGVILFFTGVYDWALTLPYDIAFSIVIILLGIGLVIGGGIMCGVAGRSAEIYKVCPQCAERVRKEAEVCKHCGHKFEESE